MRLEDVSHLGRPVDLGCATNRAIVLFSGLCFLGLAVWSLACGSGFGVATSVGGWGALSVFLGWALAREVDPVGERAAFAGAVLTLAWVVGSGAYADVAGLFWALLTIRVVNRTTGVSASWLDTGLLLGLTGWGALDGFPFIAPFAVVALAVDGFVGPRPSLRHRVAAVVALGIAVGAFVRDPGLDPVATFDWKAWIGVAVAVVFVLRVVRFDPRRVGDDENGAPLVAVRVRIAQGLALALVTSAWLLGQHAAFAPLGAAIGGAALMPRR